jgi:predicted translin family RNA/ssDNA-binding protein
VQGRDVLKELDEMRDALLLLKRDVDMESKYPKLKELKDEYERALEKYKTFEALK